MSCPEHAKMAELVNSQFGNSPGNFDLTQLPQELRDALSGYAQEAVPYVQREMPFQFFTGEQLLAQMNKKKAEWSIGQKWQMWRDLTGEKLWQFKKQLRQSFPGSILDNELRRPDRPWNQWLDQYSPAVTKQREMDDALYEQRDRVWSKEEIYETFDYDVEAANRYIKKWESYLIQKKGQRLEAGQGFEEPEDSRNTQQLLVFTKHKDVKYLYTKDELVNELVLSAIENVDPMGNDEIREAYFRQTVLELRTAAAEPGLSYAKRNRFLRQADLLEPEANPLLEKSMLKERNLLKTYEDLWQQKWQAMMQPQAKPLRQKYAKTCKEAMKQQPQLWRSLLSTEPAAIKKTFDSLSLQDKIDFRHKLRFMANYSDDFVWLYRKQARQALKVISTMDGQFFNNELPPTYKYY